MKSTLLTLFVFFFMASPASAHRMWINVFESHIHAPSHAMVSLGWGHSLPMDDNLASTNSRVKVEGFQLIEPSGQVTDLSFPPFEVRGPEKITENVELFAADLGTQKVALKEDSLPGVYQFAAASVPTYYTTYIDTRGRQRMKLKPLDEIQDVKKVLMSFKYQAFAKSYMTVGSWKQPELLGHGLEILPRTDLSNLHAGDLVEVDVYLYGKPLSANSMDFIVAYGSSFGQSDDFFLGAYINEGRASFRVQSAGQWIVALYHKEEITQDGPLKSMYGKAERLFNGATLTFTVK